MDPIIYYDNLLLSGTLTGTRASQTNPVRLVDDGSINVPYTITSAQTTQSGSVYVTLTSAQLPAALSIPKCVIPSGYTLKLQSMSNAVNETGLVTVLSATFTSETRSYLAELPSGTVAATIWRVMLSGVSGLVSARVHEVQLAPTRAVLGVPQVGIARRKIRQYARTPVPGGQPFVRRDGPILDASTYVLVAISGAPSDTPGLSDQGTIEAFIQAVDGGDAFTITDDLARTYWAELVDMEPDFNDEAGAFTWKLNIQEIEID